MEGVAHHIFALTFHQGVYVVNAISRPMLNANSIRDVLETYRKKYTLVSTPSHLGVGVNNLREQNNSERTHLNRASRTEYGELNPQPSFHQTRAVILQDGYPHRRTLPSVDHGRSQQ